MDLSHLRVTPINLRYSEMERAADAIAKALFEWIRLDAERIERELMWAVENMDMADIHALHVVLDYDGLALIDGDLITFISPRSIACTWPRPERADNSELVALIRDHLRQLEHEL